MDPLMLSKIGNVTIQRLPLKQDDTDKIENSSMVSEPSSPSLHTLQLPKLPPSINITIKSTNVALDSTKKNSANTIAEQEESWETNSSPDSDHSGKLPIIDEENLETETENCDKNENAQDDDKLQEIVGKTTDLNEKVDLEGLATVKMLQSAAIIEELPSIKEELMDAEEFHKNQLDVDESGESSNVVANELSEEMICKEEKYSDNEGDLETEEDNESDDADDEHDERQDDKKVVRKKKRKARSKDENKDSKKQKKSQDDKNTDAEDKEKTSELKVGNLRKNIREVMDETKLDEATLAAQLQEKERLRRVQEQLRANRDSQRQARVISRFEKSLCTTPIKEEAFDDNEAEEQKPNTVVVKLTTGSSNQMLDMLKKHKNSSTFEDEDVSLEKFKNLSNNLNKPHMMTKSVSIVPVSREQKTEEVLEPIAEEIPEDKAKGKDVVMISSDEDDCIVISEGEEESEPEEDTANSGMHTNDLYNVPDTMGRVLVNVGHPENEEDVFLAPQIARIIKPHQIGGIRFLYDNIVESLGRYRTSEGFGCILAHSMGLGKTLQVISFSDVFLRYTEGKSILCIMPINTLQNWVSEFNMWLPIDPDNSPLKKDGEVSKRQFPLFVLNDNQKTLSARAKVISQWHQEGGVLLIGYELYRQLSLKKPPKSRTRSKKRLEPEEDVTDEKSKNLLEIMYNALVNPGPDLVICDEGHRIKNSHASISQALKQIKTKRRVVLTGYPLQNNLLEYWCMVDFVRPNYLGSKTEYSNMFERPIMNGQCIDSTPQDVKLMRFRSHVLHSLLEGFVQRRSHSVLQETLPSKFEFVILLRFTQFQKQLYNTFMNEVVRTKAVPNPLKAFAVCCKIWNHPDILYNFLKKRAGEEDIDLDLDDTTSSLGVSASSGPSTPMTPATPPQQSVNKRGRSRSTKGSQSKNAKVPRKKTGESTSQSQPAPIATAASTSMNDSAEQTPACNQPIPPFNSFNNVNNNTVNDTNVGLNYGPQQSDNAGQNFSNQYNKQAPQQQQQPTEQPQQQRQEYNVQSTSSNVDFSTNVNFQPVPNYSENSYYRAEYAQNYWQGNNNNNSNNNNNNANTTNSNNFTSSTTAGSDNYYQPASQNTQQQQPHQQQQQQQQQQYVSAGNYSPGNEVIPQAGYNNHNYNFDLNQPQQMYSNTAAPNNVGDFSGKGEINSMHSFAVGDNNLLLANNSMFGDGPMNYDIGSSMNQLNDFQGASGRTPPSTFNNPVVQNPPQMRAKRPGRPPLSQARTRGGASMNPRSGVTGRKRGGAVALPPHNTNNVACFRPGLTGGAPILKGDGQNYSLGESDTNNTFASQPFNLDSINNEELWNPGQSDQNTMFVEQAFSMFHNQGTDPNNAFMPTETSTLLGGVRASRGLLNDIRTDEIFNPASNHSSVYSQGSDTGQGLYIDNYNYLDNISIPTQSSFMGLLRHEEGLNTQETQNIENLARSGQISLKIVDNKKESDGATFSKNQTTQNVLPSMDLFNAKQNFVTNANTYSYQSEERGANVLDQANNNNQGAWSSFNRSGTQSSPVYQDEINSPAVNDDAKMMSRFEANRNVSLINVTEPKNIGERPTEGKPETISSPLGTQSVPCNSAVGMMKLNSNSDSFVSPAPKTDIQPEFSTPQQRSNTFPCNDEANSETKMPAPEVPLVKAGRDNEPGIPYEWANEFFKNYEPGMIESSGKMVVFICMLDKIIKLGDRVLLFSQSLFTLDLIEEFLHKFDIPNTEEKWARNKSYFRLDGSTTALEREKLINEFNANRNIHIFLVSTRAGSLGINLVGANRVIVFDASWNPCHDTQAVCRVYRYGQVKNCFVYRFVMDNCLEKKIYDRQINKQGMSDRIVDECNPEAHLTMKDVSSLCWDTDDVPESKKDFKDCLHKYNDEVIRTVIEKHSSYLSKEPFIHESLLIDRKESKLSQAEKRMAKRGYELEKQANSKPTYPGFYNTPQTMNNRLGKPMTSVRPMIIEQQRDPIRRWIPPEVWKKQGMSAQEMTLPLDVEIPNSNDTRIVLKAGQKVMVLKSHKGIYMQLENGKIVAIKQHKPSPPIIGGGVNDNKIGNMMPRNNPSPHMQGGSMGPMAGVNRMIHRPPMLDRTMSPLANRRDIAMSQLRNRFVRPNAGAQNPAALGASIPTMPNVIRPHLPSATRFMNRGPNLMQRSFAGGPRPQVGRPPQSQQIQQRQQTQLPLPSTTVGGKSIFGPNSAVTLSVAANTKKLEQQMSHEKDRMSHLTEVDYGDYNSNRVSQYGDYSVTSGDTTTQAARNMQYVAGRNADVYRTALSPPPRKPTPSNVIPESLRRKREINLTPVVQTSLAHKNQPHQQSSYQPPLMGKVRPSLPYPSTSKSAETIPKNSSVTPSLPKSGGAISIFPVGKKPEDSNAQVFEQSTFQHALNHFANLANKQQASQPQSYQGYQENPNAYFSPGFNQQQSSQNFPSYSSSGNEFTANPYSDSASGDFTSTALSNVSQTPGYSQYDSPIFYNNNCPQQASKTDSI